MEIDKPVRPSALTRRRARKAAAAAADGAIRALQKRLQVLEKVLGRLTCVDDNAPAEEWAIELARREAEIRPVLVKLIRGIPPEPEETLHCNVAKHAEQLPGADAPACEWRRAQKGPRIEARRTAASGCGPITEWMPVALPVPPGATGFGARLGGAIVAASRRAKEVPDDPPGARYIAST